VLTPKLNRKVRLLLQSRRGDEWLDLYAFTLEEAHPVDYEVANYYISTNPHSPFMHMLL
jgi:N-hydroxyarylamine O-acetyltransferase